MKIAYLFVLGTALLIAPAVTHAQISGSISGDSNVAARSNAHASIDWAKERLDEMDAALALAEKRLGELKSENRAKAERALAEMRQQREAFNEAIKAKKDASEVEWRRTRKQLESRWIAFEAAVQRWVAATGESVAQQNEILIAQAEAQLNAWNAKIDQFQGKLQSSANEFSAARKREVESTLAAMRAEAEGAKARLESLKQSGKVSWSAFRKALAESRAAFDRANQTAYQAFKRTTS
jgi:hypothetical protein